MLIAHPICILVVDNNTCWVVNGGVNDFDDEDDTSYVVQSDDNDANTEFEGSLRRRRLESLLQWETACLCIVESNNFLL